MYFCSDLICGIFENWAVFKEWSIKNPNCMCYLFDLIKNISDEYRRLEKSNSRCQREVFVWLLGFLTNPQVPILVIKQILELLPPFIAEENNEINGDFQ